MGRMCCNFYSYSLQREITLHVLLPFLSAENKGTSHKIQAPYPVLYLLHGGANDCSTFERYTSVERYAQEANIAVVLFSAENKYYRTLETINDGEKAKTEDFSQLLHYELPEFLAAWLPILSESEHTYLAGFSMGGYGTAFHAMLHPERFRAVGIFSGLVFQRPLVFRPLEELNRMSEEERTAALLPELLELMERNRQRGVKLPDAFFSIGTKDIIHFLPAFAKRWSENCSFVSTDFDSKPYAHEWTFWDRTLEEFLHWIPRTDFYAEKEV